jgi:hypothetical protein
MERELKRIDHDRSDMRLVGIVLGKIRSCATT